jgi:arsenate reductase (thioredoxin)
VTAHAEAPVRVLFVCTHNSARSQMAEAVLRARGGDRFAAFSAGTEPGRVHPLTLRVLHEAGIDASGLRSKSVAEFAGEAFDLVVTVCDQAREACPVFPGAARMAHWGYDDPSQATGSGDERLGAFREVLRRIEERVDAYVSETDGAHADGAHADGAHADGAHADAGAGARSAG